MKRFGPPAPLDLCMAQEIFLGISGVVLLATRVWLIHSTPHRPKAVAPLAGLLWFCGLLAIVGTALEAGSAWSLRSVVIGTYSAAGVFLGETAINILSKSRAGDVLASFRKSAPRGLNLVLALVPAIAICGIVMECVHKPGSTTVLVGQTVFFVTFGAWAGMMSRIRWTLAEHGIAGPNVFVPWQKILAYKWQGANIVAITTAGFFSGVRRFTISVAPEDSKLAAAILARKVPVY